ncbi:DUF3011 family protein [Edaphobacter aggregans]|jgi:hypothetical protein|uniref:DUF3011 family protein n=1 Tax=Edaphobacter aggregans TaxID=570835 RepID=A0A3R9NUI9_9BACT|nr:DUF3011 domain-containing protein [Edaphobacter aggregans]RSL14909.1 DUF3011 family protein [Edaphobacter aggregans]
MKLTSQLLLLFALLGCYCQCQGQTITCSSNDGRRNFCSVNTRGGVRLSRQISGSACIQNQTWGWDNSGVWVDRGCRAEFVVGGGGGNWGGNNQGQTVTCSSNDGRRNFCNVDTRGGVRLNRQISGSACVQNQTWGFNNNSIWVDRGCRAEFIVGSGSGGGNNWNPGRPGQGGGQTITCSSNDGRRNFCNVDTRGGVRLNRQISGSACVQNQTWGWNNNSIWVDRGCRAEFIVGR